MVEVFKTNVNDTVKAAGIVQLIGQMFEGAKASFDLEDRDKILRVESPAAFDVEGLIALLEKNNCRAAVLPDEISFKGLHIESIKKYSLSA